MVVWITGLAGVGKSSIAAEVSRMLRQDGRPTVLLDGDAVRAAVADPHAGHDREGRLANAWRICRLAQNFEAQGLVVVVATMSLFHAVHAWNRRQLAAYVEVLVEASLESLARRDPHCLYGRAARGAAADVVGVDLAAELPREPHLVIANDADDPGFAPRAAALVRARLPAEAPAG